MHSIKASNLLFLSVYHHLQYLHHAHFQRDLWRTVNRQVRKASTHSINVRTSLTPSLSTASMKPLSLLHCSEISASWDVMQARGLISGYDEVGWVESHWWHCNGQHPHHPATFKQRYNGQHVALNSNDSGECFRSPSCRVPAGPRRGGDDCWLCF